MRRFLLIPLITGLALVTSADAGILPDTEADLKFYLSGESVAMNGVSGLLLTLDEPASPQATTLSVLPPLGDDSLTWYTGEPWAVDLAVPAEVGVTLQFDTGGVEALATVTVRLIDVDPDGRQNPLGSDSQAVLLSALVAHTETFSVALAPDAVLAAGHILGLEVQVTGVDAIAPLTYGDGGSTVSPLTVGVLDSDDDGFGDTAERLAGTDPFDATSFPGGGPVVVGTSSGDDDEPEGIVASGLFLATFLVLGVALLGRYSS